MSTGTNGDSVSPANCVGLDKNSPRIVVMEKVGMHTAQPALPADSKAAGATIDVRLASPVLSSIVSRRPTAQLPLMLSVGTVCLGAFQLSLVKADVPTVPPQEATLVALMSSLFVVFTLAFLGLFFLYCKQFFNRHCQRVAGGSLQFEADEAAEEESLFTMPPGQETSPESPLSESIFETQPLNPILDDDCSSTCGFPTQESFTMASCASESHSHWVHTPIECTELDLQTFSSSASYTGAETLRGDTAENSEDRLEFNMPFEVPSP
ncbi:tumor necrosis factor receptor superfamily member 27 isoform X3 [Mirounga angustirostris]|uniref:tumor necrosis factor receptor superfamily member 27 isoform X2 n=1 Tax=Mirounga leonina TaxID=9715 RepID=UPI00156C28A7|nr:tumor necrosis factor receptor superfamily member 27 isoform X2 [Mirounga leonina]XP_034868313.1 tumor necrosis factor receptor superfamily member 27 isoform X2 [Mirounga leonina]XP_034868385.1 tumor necrosis factor receptor superfamily member 27 isoform X2 [Mirounga leonina]XP_045735132.1 tumor necrosis factor receptor superfamily member 27 isoform X2 [Mirounga angustirostris]XP_045735136.1 tumor necrosis factor receptor superfamily member 27 isoform X2 [Mirounga angustirostris]XP_04573514